MPTIIGISDTPPVSSALPKVKRGCAPGLSRPMLATSRPSISEVTALSLLDEPMNTALDRPSTTSQKYSNDENLSATSASDGAAAISTAVPNSPPITENTRPAPSAISAWPFLRHRIGLVGVGGRRRRAGDAQQRTGDVAGEDRHRGAADDRRHRRHRRDEERDRHQQRGGHRRGEPGHRADEQAEQRRGEDHPQHIGVEDQREGLAEDGPGHARCQLSTARAARPRAAARAGPCRTRRGSRSVATSATGSATTGRTRSASISAASDQRADDRKPTRSPTPARTAASPATVTTKASSWRRPAHPVTAREPRRLRARRAAPCTISSSEHTASPSGQPGNAAGPTFWPGMRRVALDASRAPAATARRTSAPKTASLIFIAMARETVGCARARVTWRCPRPSSSRRGRRRT